MATAWSSTSVCRKASKANCFGPSGRSETAIWRPSITSCSTPISTTWSSRSEEHTSELQSLAYLVCRLLLEKKKKKRKKVDSRDKTKDTSLGWTHRIQCTETR